MISQSPLNPDALANLRLLANRATQEIRHAVVEPDILHKLLDIATTAALPEVTSVEELEALPQESVIRTVVFGVVRERFDSGWLATGGEGFDQSTDIAGRTHVVLYRPEVKQ